MFTLGELPTQAEPIEPADRPGVRVPLESAHSVSPAPRNVWRRVLDTDPNVLATQTSQWTDAMVDSGGWVDASRWYEI